MGQTFCQLLYRINHSSWLIYWQIKIWHSFLGLLSSFNNFFFVAIVSIDDHFPYSILFNEATVRQISSSELLLTTPRLNPTTLLTFDITEELVETSLTRASSRRTEALQVSVSVTKQSDMASRNMVLSSGGVEMTLASWRSRNVFRRPVLTSSVVLLDSKSGTMCRMTWS